MSASLSVISSDFLPAQTHLFDSIKFDRDSALVIRYRDAPVYFCLLGRGKALEIHVAAEGRGGRRALRDALACLPSWVESEGIQCHMLIATISKRSVINLVRKCGWLSQGLLYIESKKGHAHLFVMPITRQ